MNKMYFRGVHGVVLVCDLCDSESFQDLEVWMSDFAENCDREELSDIAFVLLGNKHDIAKSKVSTATP